MTQTFPNKNSSNLTKKYFDIDWLLSIAQDDFSKKKIKEIETWNKEIERGVFRESDNLFILKLGKHVIWMRESEAWFSVHLYCHIFNKKEHLDFQDFDGKNVSTVIDMGANIGMYTLAIKDSSPECKIIAFEPNPKAFELLLKNIQSNHLDNVIAVNKGVSKLSGAFNLKVLDEGSPYGGKYLGNIKKEYRTWINEKRIKNVKVESLSLPEIFKVFNISSVDILKMDVEGMEFEILDGGIEILSKIKRIVLEWHDHESKNKIGNLLTKESFDLVHDDGREYGNLYFVRK